MIIAMANQKGGVGKTTCVINLAAALSMRKQRILLVDLDPQGSATVGCGCDKKTLRCSVNAVLLGEKEAHDLLFQTSWGFDLLPANGDLTISEVRLLQMDQKEKILSEALKKIKRNYDFIIIDCPPSLNMLTVNALVAADSVIVPVQCEYYALEGLTSLLSSIDHIRQTANPNLKIEGVLRTMYDGRNRLTLDVSEQLVAHFGDKIYQTVIPRNVRLAEAPSYGVPVIYYDKNSQGAIAYLALADEVLANHVLMTM